MARTRVTRQGLTIRDNATKFYTLMVNQMAKYNIRWTSKEKVVIKSVRGSDSALKAAVYEAIYKRHNAIKNRKNKKRAVKFSGSYASFCPHCTCDNCRRAANAAA